MQSCTSMTNEKIKRVCFLAEIFYITYMCILMAMQIISIETFTYHNLKFVMVTYILLILIYSATVFAFSGKGDSPSLLEMIFRLIYLLAAVHILGNIADPSIQVIIVLPTIIMALRYKRGYAIFMTLATTAILIVSEIMNRSFGFDGLVIVLSFIWFLGFLFSILREVQLTAESEMQKILKREKLAAIGQMAAGIAHEIRNPLATIKGLVQLLDRLNGIKDPDTLKGYLQVMDKEVNRVNELLQDFLQYAKPKHSKLDVYNLNNTILDLQMMISSHCINNSVELDLQLDSDLPEVRCDANQMKQVVLNIILNAIDAMSDSVEKLLTIITGFDREEVFLKVVDTGCGISSEELGKTFTPFYTTKNSGSGLGLCICNSIIEDHQGEIRIDSVVGQGTIFTILLPR